MCDIFHQEVFEEIIRDSTQLRTYWENQNKDRTRKIPTRNIKVHTDIFCMRLSNHKLAIEKGRHHKI